MEPVIRSVNVSTLRDGLSEAVRKVELRGSSYVLRRHGQPVAVLVSMNAAKLVWDAQLRALHEAHQRGETPELGSPPAPLPANVPDEKRGYLRRLLRRRQRRRNSRAEQAVAQAAAEIRAYRTGRSGEDGL